MNSCGKDRLGFVAGDIFRDVFGETLGVCHFPEDAAAGGGDAFDGGEGAVGVEGVLHGGGAGGIAVLGGDLAVGGEGGESFRRGEKLALAVGDGNGVDFTDGHVREPRGRVRYNPGLDVLGDVAGNVVVD